ncbi:sphingomyelin phosphodiesterase 5-like isoform X2 [Hemicordylus capensis]|uniref:sphingomyelin phosphodiesterase 5-like isoform X2 n=1 Tax=Hemicordylus capensis TaxID=884348 RepID=UPI002302145D|nr:sphingomyelin phosphodiesterase 5-like isoform X2 [Hemicordylus capensis]
MGLRESPYASRFLGGLDAVVSSFLFPSYWLVSQLLALQQTTAEKQRQPCPLHALWVLLAGPLLLLPLLLLAPCSLLAFLVWLPLQAARRPFAYQHTPSPCPPQPCLLPGQGKAFAFVSANVCLLPDGLAKFSNLAQTQQRAQHIAQRLARAAQRPAPLQEPHARGAPSKQKYGATDSSPLGACRSPPPGDHRHVAVQMALDGGGEITAVFPPHADFLCLQEVFDSQASARLRRLLSPHYAHILYDVGLTGLLGCSALKLLNSGLFLASRYPLLAVHYHCYPNGSGEDAFCAKGLLCVQVQLGASQGQRIVGYLNCTHLHAPEADAQIRSDQLTLGLHWAQLFQDANQQPGDIVAFDVYCGDLNFDTCSPDDAMEQNHEIFTLYTDPCRLGPRKDKPWAIGTLMNYLEIYSEAVSTPEKMKRALEQAEGRRKYLAGPILANGAPDLSGPRGEGRRIDYILYREHPGPAELTTDRFCNDYPNTTSSPSPKRAHNGFAPSWNPCSATGRRSGALLCLQVSKGFCFPAAFQKRRPKQGAAIGHNPAQPAPAGFSGGVPRLLQAMPLKSVGPQRAPLPVRLCLLSLLPHV